MSSAVAVLGAGAWGTALAIALARNGHPVRLWTRSADQRAEMAALRSNRRYLPDLVLGDAIHVAETLADALDGAEATLVAVPMRALDTTLAALRPRLGARDLAGACKGIETATGRLAHQIAGAHFASGAWAMISGPSFAGETALGMPTALTVAAANAGHADRWAARLHGGALRVYTTDDVVGVELAGAVKNVLAIAAGLSDGLGFGANARAALVTRGLAEIARLGLSLGGRPETFQGLAGLGDLVLTCTDNQSRNRRVGVALGEGATLAEALAALGQVAEGVPTAAALRELAARHHVEMPICAAVAQVLDGAIAPRAAVQALMGREMRAEN